VAADQADAVISGEPKVHRSLVLGEMSSEEAIARKKIRIQGDADKALRVLALFQD